MTKAQLIDLGRRAVACKGWRWMPGMLVLSTNNYHRPARIESLDGETYGLTVIPDADGPVFAAHHEYGIAGEFPRGSSVPDLRDPATLGCLLSLVREVAEPERAPGNWPLVCTHESAAHKWGVGAWLNESGKATFAALVLPTYPTEAAALVAALEASDVA
jgi:hypothetical protein